MGIRLIKVFTFKQRDITRPACACIVFQRMAHHNHPIHLNHPHLSFPNYGDQKSQKRHIVLAFNCLLQNIPAEKYKILDIYSVVTL